MRRPMFRGGGISRLGGVLNASLEEMGLRHKVMEFQVVARWPEVVGSNIAGASMADKIRDGVLYVCCKSSTWANELSFHKEHIMKKLNDSAGKKIVTDIRFTSRGYRKVAQARKDQGSSVLRGLDKIEVGENASRLAEKVASVAAAPELAAKIQKAVLTSKRLEIVKNGD
ncbi:MAG: DUF721 domain-containing protein [Armatimonadota bacterium]|nr:DUF721 domain-containing protein [bacterium]